MPIILHDIPARILRELADDTLMRLAESKQLIGLRDGTGDVIRPMRLRSVLPQSFRLMSGHDATALAYLAEGGNGIISITSNVTPDLCRAIFFKPEAGASADRARPSEAPPLESCVSNQSPATVKYALSLLGLMHPRTRLPIVQLDRAAKAAVARAVAEIDEDVVADAAEAR